MKGFLSIAATAALLQASSAHYIFSNLIVDGNYTGTYEYVRKNTNNNSPLMDPTSDDFRCNTGAQDSAATTNTYTVAAGATVGMGVGFGGTVIHPGPLLVYLSKAPDGTSASAYDGSGDWFKIHELGTSVINSTGMFWETTDKANFTWTLPADTPPGDYLMRTEHIALHQAETAGGAQYYMECAQLSVTGGDSSATPSPTAKIPGIYSETDPGIEINIYYPIPSSYTFPGPAIWPAGADSSGSSNSTASTGSTGSSAISSVASQIPSAAVSAFSHFANATATASTGKKATSLAAVSSDAAATAAGGSSLGSSSSGSSSSGSGAGSSGSDSGSSGSAVTSAPAAAAASGNSNANGAQTLYGQCGGEGYTGATACAVGSCVSQNAYYHQCVSTEGAAAVATGANKAATSAAASQITSVAAAEPSAAVATTFVTSKKKCTGGANKAAKSSRPVGTGGIRPSGGALPTGGFGHPSGSLRSSGSGFRPTRTGGLPMVTAE